MKKTIIERIVVALELQSGEGIVLWIPSRFNHLFPADSIPEDMHREVERGLRRDGYAVLRIADMYRSPHTHSRFLHEFQRN